MFYEILNNDFSNKLMLDFYMYKTTTNVSWMMTIDI